MCLVARRLFQEDTVKELRALPVHILGIIVGCESGVECCDSLSEALGGFPTNGVTMSLARRDKYPMGEAVRAAGLRAVKQQLCESWDLTAETFCKDLGALNRRPSWWGCF